MSFYTKITVQGADAEKFLQGQLTCDLRKASLTEPLLGAHCNPKGRIMSLFFLLKEDGGFALYLPQDLLKMAYDNLKKYGQFFKQVVLEKVENAVWLPPFIQNLDPSVPPPGTSRWDDNEKIALAHIEAGIPLIYSVTSGLFLPHDINLPQLGGVSFDKGCYTGQEIIARMQNLGKPKQHLYRVVIPARSPRRGNAGIQDNFQPGTKIYLPTKPDSEIGSIVDAAQKEDELLALASLKDSILNLGLSEWELILDQQKYNVFIFSH
jgi:folate-binding protein YgfZ